jgi:hypothetical protein
MRARVTLVSSVSLLGLLFSTSANCQNRSRAMKTIVTLQTGWQFREASKTDWHPATTFGCQIRDTDSEITSRFREGATLCFLFSVQGARDQDREIWRAATST